MCLKKMKHCKHLFHCWSENPTIWWVRTIRKTYYPPQKNETWLYCAHFILRCSKRHDKSHYTCYIQITSQCMT